MVNNLNDYRVRLLTQKFLAVYILNSCKGYTKHKIGLIFIFFSNNICPNNDILAVDFDYINTAVQRSYYSAVGAWQQIGKPQIRHE